MTAASLSKNEQIAINFYEKIHNARLLIGLVVILALTAISIRFNYIIGEWTSSDPDSNFLLPKGYALLDIALFFLCLMLAVGISNTFLKYASIVWVIVLLSLSLWASTSFNIAVDARSENTGNDLKIEQLKNNIEEQNDHIKDWKAKFKNTSHLHSLFDGKIQIAQEKRDAYQQELATLQRDNPPPALVIFDRFEHVIPGTIDKYEFQLFVRMSWSFVLVITPLLCMMVVASEIKHMLDKAFYKKKKYREAQTVPQDRTQGTGSGTVYDNKKYEQVKERILSGTLKPSVRAIKNTDLHIGTDHARQMLRDLLSEGILAKAGQGYRTAYSYAA